MAAGGGRSAGNGKSLGNGGPASHKPASKSRKRKPDRNPTNQSENRNPYVKLLTEPLLSRLSAATAAAHSFLCSNDLLLLPSQVLSLESLLSSLPISPSASSSFSASWFHRFLSSASGDGDPRWSHCFRMSRSTFFLLLSVLSPSIVSSLSSAAPPPDYVLAAALFRLAHDVSYKSIARRFGFHSSADVSRAFYTICKLVNEKLGQLNDPQPDFSPDLLPNCCGVLGFGRFEVDGQLLGSNASILVQALVDSNGRFLDLSAGWPSTMKPETIFRQTKLFSLAEAESRTFLNGPQHKLSNGISVPRYILGDSCFPLLPWLIIPYSSSSNEEEDSFETCRREFNNAHTRAVCLLGYAFASVQTRWQILKKKWRQETVEFLPFVITAGCLLHNFLVNCGENLLDKGTDDIDYNSVLWMRKDEEKEEEEEVREYEGEMDLGSRRIRDAIAENLSQVSLRRRSEVTSLSLYA